jgi:hypothetical protein
MPIDARGFQLVPDASQGVANIRDMITQTISQRLQQRALGGDQVAQSNLSGVDPNAANAVGGILRGNQQQVQYDQQQEQIKAQKGQEMARRIASGYQSAKDKGGYLAWAYQHLIQSGETELAQHVKDDLDQYASNPAQVDQEYSALHNMYNKPEGKTAAEKERDQTIADLKSNDPVVSAYARLKIGQDAKAGVLSNGMNMKMGDIQNMSQEDYDFFGQRYAMGDVSVVRNASKVDAAGIKAASRKYTQSLGGNANDQIQASFDNAADKRGNVDLAAREAKIAPRVQEARNMIPIALQTSDAFDRSDFRPSSLGQNWWAKQTNDPKQLSLNAATNSFINAYDAAVTGASGGTVSGKEHAHEMLNTVQSKEGYKAVMDVLDKEMEAALKSPGQIREMMAGHTKNRNSKSSAPQGGQAKDFDLEYDPASGTFK